MKVIFFLIVMSVMCYMNEASKVKRTPPKSHNVLDRINVFGHHVPNEKLEYDKIDVEVLGIKKLLFDTITAGNLTADENILNFDEPDDIGMISDVGQQMGA